jgi:hypothetical protein
MPSPSSGRSGAGLAAGVGGAVLAQEVSEDATLASEAAHGDGRGTGVQRFGLVPRIGLVVFLLILLASLLAPVLPIDNPLQQTLSLRNAGPSLHHLLGTDLVGRDVFSRVIYGCRSAFEGVGIGVLAMLLLGVPWGLAAGFSGAAVDEVLMRIADAMLSFPPLILAIGVVSALGPSITHAMVTVGVISAPGLARLLRSSHSRWGSVAGVSPFGMSFPTRWPRPWCRPSPPPATSSSWRRRSASWDSACRPRLRHGGRT